MPKYHFSKTSTDRLATCHQDLQKLLNRALQHSMIDFGIAEGHRTIELQQLYFKTGKSKIDGVAKKGKHNYSPSLAVDIYAFVNGKASWSERDLCYLGGLITGIASDMYSRGEIRSKIRWGGNWDGDGVIITDQSFMDLPHFELLV